MHPFCCVTTVSDQQAPAALPSHFPMAAGAAAGPGQARPDPPARSADHARVDNRPNGEHRGGHRPSVAPAAAAAGAAAAPGAVVRAASAREEPAVDVKIHDIVGNGISGILYKWVNYGKGWRKRWFVLQDGVLSYYKIHGPDKIVVNQETEKGSKVIGEESLRRISRPSTAGPSQLRRKPVGEVHLKVSSIRESRSDDRRFSIFTGTKRLHLRAETREDRLAWMEALQAVKDMFPRMSNSELMAPMDNAIVSTEKLRQNLQEEGVREDLIQECEQIMRNEAAATHNQVLLLKQKQWLLIDTLRQLEVHVMQLRKRRASRNSSSVSPTTPQNTAHSTKF